MEGQMERQLTAKLAPAELQTARELITETIDHLINVAVEMKIREREPFLEDEVGFPPSDVIEEDPGSVTAQMAGEISRLKEDLEEQTRLLNLEIQKRATLVSAVCAFREKLQTRQVNMPVPDKVLERYEEFFELKDI